MHPLHNVIWRALTTRQAHLGRSYGSARRFDPDVSLLGGFAAPSREGYASMAGLLEVGERVGVFVDEVVPRPGFEVESSAGLLQMVREAPAPLEATRAKPDAEAAPLTKADVPEMMALTELTKPGPFNVRTREMGDYFGIRVDGELVAMAGERLSVPGYTEVSAICTHPDHLGRGFAASLMALLIGGIVARGERALLHVRPENGRAVALYERLGFATRWSGRYVILRRV